MECSFTFIKHCPHCNVVMKSFCRQNDKGLFIDKCPVCDKTVIFKKCKECRAFIEDGKDMCNLCSKEKQKILEKNEQRKICVTQKQSKDSDINVFVNNEYAGSYAETQNSPCVDKKFRHEMVYMTFGLMHIQSKQIKALYDHSLLLETKINNMQCKLNELMEMIEFAPGSSNYCEAEKNFNTNIGK